MWDPIGVPYLKAVVSLQCLPEDTGYGFDSVSQKARTDTPSESAEI